METSSNLEKVCSPALSSPTAFYNFLDPLLAFSLAILCFLIYHVTYFWSVDLFALLSCVGTLCHCFPKFPISYARVKGISS